jgi:hypothetical protein
MAVTFILPRETAARLKQIAALENLSLQQVLTLAVGEWLASRQDVATIEATEPATRWDAPS